MSVLLSLSSSGLHRTYQSTGRIYTCYAGCGAVEPGRLGKSEQSVAIHLATSSPIEDERRQVKVRHQEMCSSRMAEPEQSSWVLVWYVV